MGNSMNTGQKISSPATIDRSSALVLDNETFEKLKQFIYQRSGIYLTENKRKFVETRLNKRLSSLSLGSFSEYLSYLGNMGQQTKEIDKLMNLVTITETNFFRDQAQLNALVEVVLPQIIKIKSDNDKIRILSVGCSTGEEVYSIAMLIDHYFANLLSENRIEIIGTDINHQALQTAYQGTYRSFSLRGVPQEYLNKHFQQKGDLFVINTQLRKYVQFRHISLIDSTAMMALGKFDVIFCRNVLIFFDRLAREKSVLILSDMLNPGGYLFVGQAETLHGLNHPLDLVLFRQTMGYKKSHS